MKSLRFSWVIVGGWGGEGGDYSKGAINGTLMSFSGLHIPALGSSKTLDGCVAGGAGGRFSKGCEEIIISFGDSIKCWNAHQQTVSVATLCTASLCCYCTVLCGLEAG